MIGKTLAHYEILELLGKGGMGEVYRARDQRLGRDVALKILPAQMASDPQRKARFQREARAVAALNHRNIVTIFSVETDGEHSFLTMELVPGNDLAAQIPAGGLAIERSVHIAGQIADALAAAERPVVFGGTGLRWSRQPAYTDALTAFVDSLRAPVYLNSLARGSLRFDHPLLGNRSRSIALGDADVVVALGVDWDFRTGFGKAVRSDATVIHIDAEPVRVGWNRGADIGVVADPGTVTAQLLDAAGKYAPTSDRDWTEQMASAERELQAVAEEAAGADGSPVPPERFAREVAEFFRRTEPHSPISYLVERAVRWGHLPLEGLLKEVVKNDDVLNRIWETLGLDQSGGTPETEK